MENYIKYLKERIAFYEQSSALVIKAIEKSNKSMAKMGTLYNKVQNIINLYQQLLKYAEQPVEYFIKALKLYGPFKEIFYCLEGSTFTAYDKLGIVEHFVSINIAVLQDCLAVQEFKNNQIINLEKLSDYDFKSVTEEELRAMLESGELVAITQKEEATLSDRERHILMELRQFHEKFPVTIDEQWELFNRFKVHYIDKNDTFDLDDIAEIAFLEQVEIPEQDVEDIHKYLSKEYYRRQSRMLKTSQKSVKNDNPLAENPHVVANNRRSYKEIIHEIKSFYDNGNFVRPLTQSELYYLLSLMLDVSFPQETIIKTIEMWYNEQERSNIFTEYLLNYDRYAYYAPRQHYETDLSFLDELFGSIFITTDDDYEATKQYMLEECTRMDTLINSKYCYDYEIAQAYKLLNKKGN